MPAVRAGGSRGRRWASADLPGRRPAWSLPSACSRCGPATPSTTATPSPTARSPCSTSPRCAPSWPSRLTEQLARAGNQNAVNFRPAFQLAVEAAIDTDTFRSIFRTAVHRTHQAVLASNQGDDASALDLSDSVSLIVANLSLPSSAAPGQSNPGSLDNSLGDVTQRLSDLRVWSWQDYSGTVALLGLRRRTGPRRRGHRPVDAPAAHAFDASGGG